MSQTRTVSFGRSHEQTIPKSYSDYCAGCHTMLKKLNLSESSSGVSSPGGSATTRLGELGSCDWRNKVRTPVESEPTSLMLCGVDASTTSVTLAGIAALALPLVRSILNGWVLAPGTSKVRIKSSPLTGPFTPSTAVSMGISRLISLDSSFEDELEHAASDSANRIARGATLSFNRADPV